MPRTSIILLGSLHYPTGKIYSSGQKFLELLVRIGTIYTILLIAKTNYLLKLYFIIQSPHPPMQCGATTRPIQPNIAWGKGGGGLVIFCTHWGHIYPHNEGKGFQHFWPGLWLSQVLASRKNPNNPNILPSATVPGIY